MTISSSRSIALGLRVLWTGDTLLEEGLEDFAWWTLEGIRKAGPVHVFSPRDILALLPSITRESAITMTSPRVLGL